MNSQQIDQEEMVASMMQDPSLQNIMPEIAKAMVAWNLTFLNEKAVVIQPQKASGDQSAGSGSSKEPADGMAPTEQLEPGNGNMTEKILSETEMGVALANWGGQGCSRQKAQESQTNKKQTACKTKGRFKKEAL